MSTNKLSLILSGGGVKAVSYLAFLDVLQKAGIEFDLIGAYSGGSLVATLWGLGKDYREIVKIAGDLSFWKLFERRFFTRRSFMSGDTIRKKITSLAGEATFEDLKYKTVIYSANLDERKIVFFEKGKLVDPLIASISLAPIIPIARIDGKEYVDAGFLTVFPTKLQRTLTKAPILGLVTRRESLASMKFLEKSMPAFSMLLANYYKMLYEDEKPELDFMTIEKNKGHLFSFKYVDDYYEEGYKAAKKHLPEILKFLENYKPNEN